jgi:hypothetical protein
VGKRQWRVRKRGLVAGEAERRGFDGGVEGDGGGSLAGSIRSLDRELNREVMKDRGWGRTEAMRVENWGIVLRSRIPYEKLPKQIFHVQKV